MELKVGDRFITKKGQLIEITGISKYEFIHKQYIPQFKDWILNTIPIKINELEKGLANKEFFLDSPAARTLYMDQSAVEVLNSRKI